MQLQTDEAWSCGEDSLALYQKEKVVGMDNELL